jgi:hypothetical protein
MKIRVEYTLTRNMIQTGIVSCLYHGDDCSEKNILSHLKKGLGQFGDYLLDKTSNPMWQWFYEQEKYNQKDIDTIISKYWK